MSILAEHMLEVKPSAVSLVAARALELEREGRSIIRLSAGEPDFPTPDHIKLACMRALCEDKTKYPPAVGLPELREAICRKLLRDNRLAYRPDQVIVSTGAKQVLFNALAASLDPGDEVAMLAPYWMSYPGMTRLHRGRPVFVPTRPEDGFRPDPDRLERALTPRAKWLILNSPGNPSGAVLTGPELAGLAEVLRRHPGVWVLCDDIYEHLVFGGARFVSLLNVAPDRAERTRVVNGRSKPYCLPGGRLGDAAGPAELIKAMFKVQSQSTSGATTFCQWRGWPPWTATTPFVARHNAEYKRRRDLVVALLNQVPGLPAGRRREPSTASSPARSSWAGRPRPAWSSRTTRNWSAISWRRRGWRWCMALPSGCRPASASPSPPPGR